jgi:hypothetical protein
MDYPRAWQICKESKMEDHHPKCSYRVMGLLCDCDVITKHPEYGAALMPKELTAENGAKAALIGEFFETCEVPCPCQEHIGEDGERCPLCGGEGVVTQKIPVSWTTIKEIYKAAVKAVGREMRGDLLW